MSGADEWVDLPCVPGAQYRFLVGWLTTLMTQWKARGVALSAEEQALLGALLYPPSQKRPVVDGSAGPAAPSHCTTREAAQRLRTTVRTVQRACARGDLESRRAGGRGPYLVSEASVASVEHKRDAASVPTPS